MSTHTLQRFLTTASLLLASSLSWAVEYDLYAWGRNDFGQSAVPTWVNQGNPIFVDAGERHTVGLFDNGMMFAFGDNSFGQSQVLTRQNIESEGATKIIAIRAGARHTIALLDNQKIIGFGDATDGKVTTQKFPGFTTLGLDAGENQNVLHARRNTNGRLYLYFWGNSSESGRANGLFLLTSLTGFTIPEVTSLAGGNLAHLFCFNQTAPTSSAGVVAILGNFIGSFPASFPTSGYDMVRTLGQSVLALRSGALYAWTTSGPTLTNGGTGIDSMAVGQQHYVTLGLDGSLTYYTLGGFAANNYGQTQTPANVQSHPAKLVAAGWYHTLALVEKSAEALPPAPQVVLAGGNVTVTVDPPALHTGYTLESSPDLTGWTPETIPVGSNTLTKAGVGSQYFFRLKRSAGTLTLENEDKRNVLSPAKMGQFTP